MLPDATGLDKATARRTAVALRGRGGALDVMPLARTLPVEALAATLGISPYVHRTIATLVGRLCDTLSPSLHPPALQPDDDDAAARELSAILAGIGGWGGEPLAAVAGLLFQARDATAALIGAAVLGNEAAAAHDPATSVEQALRHHAPVQATRRTALEEVVLGGVTVPRGASVWVVLAAAEHGPPSPPATFGSGPHGCPGAGQAQALAAGVVSALRAEGWRPVPGQPVDYEPRPNLRMPAQVQIERP